MATRGRWEAQIIFEMFFWWLRPNRSVKFFDPKVKNITFYLSFPTVYGMALCLFFEKNPLVGWCAENEILLCKPTLLCIFVFNKFFVRPIFRGAISLALPWKIGFWPLGPINYFWGPIFLWVLNCSRVGGYFGMVGFSISHVLNLSTATEHCAIVHL